MSLINDQDKFLLDVSKLIIYARAKGFKVTAGELLRTKEQQEIYFKEGKSKTLNSQHLKRLAIDINFFKDNIYINGLPIKECLESLEQIGVYWESLDIKNRWGGHFKSFKDTPHFERMD